MKLYTEEQVRKIISKTKEFKNLSDDWLIATIAPIELPSDDEIEEEFDTHDEKYYIFSEGAKWMRDKILNK